MFLFRGLYYRPGGSGQVRALINLKKREGKKKKVSKTKTKKLLIYGITICFSILSFIIFLSRTPHSLSAEATADLAVSQNSLYRGRRRGGGGGADRSIERWGFSSRLSTRRGATRTRTRESKYTGQARGPRHDGVEGGGKGLEGRAGEGRHARKAGKGEGAKSKPITTEPSVSTRRTRARPRPGPGSRVPRTPHTAAFFSREARTTTRIFLFFFLPVARLSAVEALLAAVRSAASATACAAGSTTSTTPIVSTRPNFKQKEIDVYRSLNEGRECSTRRLSPSRRTPSRPRMASSASRSSSYSTKPKLPFFF